MQFGGWYEEATQREPDLSAGRGPEAVPGHQIAGYPLLAAVYARSRALYGLLLTWHWGR